MSTQAGAMPDSYLVRWTGRLAILALPQHVGDCNAGQIREQLLWVINRGVAELIIDMTGTASCDHEGATAVARAHQRATASDTQLRLAVTTGAVQRVALPQRARPAHPHSSLPGRRYCRRGASSDRPCDAPAGRPACGAASEASRIRGLFRGGDRAGDG
jgi:anti-anti-sigma regulatory factor